VLKLLSRASFALFLPAPAHDPVTHEIGPKAASFRAIAARGYSNSDANRARRHQGKTMDLRVFSASMPGGGKSGSNGRGDNVYVMQRCTHPRFIHCEIGHIHTAKRAMTCVSPASLLRFRVRQPVYELHPFFAISAFSISLSRLRSTTSFFNFVLSSRNCLASYASLTSIPPYFAFQA
jgi:hypothetical protein